MSAPPTASSAPAGSAPSWPPDCAPPARDVVGISARSDASALRARTLVPDVPVLSPAEVAARSDVLVLAVPDDALVAVSEELSTVLRPGQVVVHTSGRHGLDALRSAARVGARPVALHPAMTFTGSSVDLGRSCAMGLTAGDAEREVAEDLAVTLGGTPVWIDDADRVRYHAALSHGANHLVTLVAQARELLHGIGAGAEASQILRPLLEAALENALDLGDAALTGPIARGDVTHRAGPRRRSRHRARLHPRRLRRHGPRHHRARRGRRSARRRHRGGRGVRPRRVGASRVGAPRVGIGRRAAARARTGLT